MDKKNFNIEKLPKTNPFRVPEGYFENLAEEIVAKLPLKEVEEPKVISLWERVKPWAYMAAMFVGIALMVRMFIGDASEPSNILSEDTSIPTSEIDEFYTYYEDQYANSFYRETFYLDDFAYSDSTQEDLDDNLN